MYLLLSIIYYGLLLERALVQALTCIITRLTFPLPVRLFDLAPAIKDVSNMTAKRISRGWGVAYLPIIAAFARLVAVGAGVAGGNLGVTFGLGRFLPSGEGAVGVGATRGAVAPLDSAARAAGQTAGGKGADGDAKEQDGEDLRELHVGLEGKKELCQRND